MSGRLRLDGPNGPVRVAALARVALVPVIVLFEQLEAPGAQPDLAFGEPLLAVLVVFALLSAAWAFLARTSLPLAPFAIADVVLLSLLVCAEGGAVADQRVMLFAPVLVAVVAGPRLTAQMAVLSVGGFVVASLANPSFGETVTGRVVAIHTLDIAWRAGLAVGVAVLLTRRAERIRELAESRRSLVSQALAAESRARRELSYALHDELVQELLCAQQDLKQARRGRAEYVDRAERAIAGAVKRLREQIFQLHPHLLERAGLEAALEAVVSHQVTDGVAPEVTVEPEATGVDDDLLFSIGRELLTNAMRHAEAAEVELTVACEDASIVLCCRDDGRGMAPGRRGEALADGHLGLAACTERVEALGGTIAIESAPGAGTRVRVAIPDTRAPLPSTPLDTPARDAPAREMSASALGAG